MMGTDPFFTDPYHFPDPDLQFFTRSFADADTLFLTKSRSGSYRRSMIAILPITDYANNINAIDKPLCIDT